MKTMFRSRKPQHSGIIKIFKAAAVFCVMLLCVFLFSKIGFKHENTLMIFLTGVLIIVVETGSYLYGFAASLLCVGIYNWFFTEPYYTFHITDISNVISLCIFFIVSLIAGMLATRLQQQIRLASQLEKAKAEVEKEKARSLLLRSISHDLRSPLTGIAGSSSFLSENYDTISKEDAVALLQDMEKDARSLTRMVENLLNMTRIQDGRLVIKKEKEVLDDLISEAVSRVIKKDSPYKAEISSDSEILLVPVDGRLMTQVFINIIDNAAKHAPEGTYIRIRTVLSQDGENAVITIADSGPGIADGMFEKIFETFYTASSSADTGRGLGLGLPICRTITEAHGGTVTAANNESGGAVFTVTLPLHAQTEVKTSGRTQKTKNNSAGRFRRFAARLRRHDL